MQVIVAIRNLFSRAIALQGQSVAMASRLSPRNIGFVLQKADLIMGPYWLRFAGRRLYSFLLIDIPLLFWWRKACARSVDAWWRRVASRPATRCNCSISGKVGSKPASSSVRTVRIRKRSIWASAISEAAAFELGGFGLDLCHRDTCPRAPIGLAFGPSGFRSGISVRVLD